MKILHLSFRAPAESDQSHLPEWIPGIPTALLCLRQTLYLQSTHSHRTAPPPTFYFLPFLHRSSQASFLHLVLHSPPQLVLISHRTSPLLPSLGGSVSGSCDSCCCACCSPSLIKDGLLEDCRVLSHRACTFFIKNLNHYLNHFSHNRMCAYLLPQIKHYRNTSLKKWDPPLQPLFLCPKKTVINRLECSLLDFFHGISMYNFYLQKWVYTTQTALYPFST